MVAGTAGNEVEVAVEDGLAGIGAVVGAEVEAGDGGVGVEDFPGEAAGEAVDGGDFRVVEVAEGGDVAAGNDESVAFGDGEAVAEGDAWTVGGDDALRREGTEDAGFGFHGLTLSGRCPIKTTLFRWRDSSVGRAGD